MGRSGWVRVAWRVVWPSLLVVVIVVVGAALSFLVQGEFTMRAYSDRVFWGGIVAILVGGFAVVASLGAYSTLGTPNVLTASGDARIAHSRVAEYLQTNARRYAFTFRMMGAGALCIAASALIGLLAS